MLKTTTVGAVLSRKLQSKKTATFLAALAAISSAACGGGQKSADSPAACPEGTVLHGSDCVPAGAAGGDDSPKPQDKPARASSDEDALPSSGGSSDSSAGGGAGGGSYDKDAVAAQLKRGAKQVKSNCGSATDDNGKAAGPWGKFNASITLGRNGHVKQVTVPAPYDGQPVGLCVVHAFEKIVFPPYAGSTDATVDWEVELVRPKK